MPELPRPFPALTPNQRLHLEVYGYVVIEQAISADLNNRLRDKVYAIEAEFRRSGTFKDRSKAMFGSSREYFRLDNLPHVDPCFVEYLTHPHLLGMVEEIIGGEARLEQSDIHIRRAPADKSAQGFGFHRGAGAPMTWRGDGGLFHCHFVKTLTNLTDLGPDDGGTTVIAGSHKLGHVPQGEIIAAAKDDPRLIHSVVAPAGSTLLFYEATIHSSGIIKSDKDRVLIIGGYTPPMFQAWEGYDVDPAFVAAAPDEMRPLLSGSKRYSWHQRQRKLSDPAQELAKEPAPE
ncbi:MAG: phytanoyl-CoA dioxygenase family protein [Planctomycetota bacterium]|nr:phytanoyl-CoA dioxygenase family protein [Planctomycetota bacterium]